MKNKFISITVPKETKEKLISSETTMGNDDGAFVMRFRNNPKAKPIKAIFGKKHIKFKTPPVQWEQKYPKNLGI